MRKLIFPVLAALAINANATTVLITADLPTERADGTPLTVDEIGAINVYGNYCGDDRKMSVGPGAFKDGRVFITDSTNKPVDQCAVTYQLSTVDSNGLESELSDPYTLNPPRLPSNVKVLIEVSF